MRRALDLIHFIVKESVTESTTKFGFDLSDLTCGMEDDSEMVIKHLVAIFLKLFLELPNRIMMLCQMKQKTAIKETM
jgi:hypothetical protein